MNGGGDDDATATLGALPPDALARALAGASDVALVVDAQGIVRDVAIGRDDLAETGIGGWLDQRWIDTVSSDSRAKVEELLGGDGALRWRQVNHPTSSGEVPVKWLAFDGGAMGRRILVGRDLREAGRIQQRLLHAQQSIERDYIRLRQTEARYRMLFDMSGEAILIVDSASRRILEANPAAERIVGRAARGLVGRGLPAIIASQSRDAVTAYLGAVSASEQMSPERIELVGRDGEFLLSASLFRLGSSTAFLLRLAPLGLAGEREPANAAVLDMIARMPDAFVVTDAQFAILSHNPAFLEMTGAARDDDVHGQPLDRFLGRPGIDVKVLVSELGQHGSVRNFATILRGVDEEEEEDEVEVSAVSTGEGEHAIHGFSIRSVARRLSPIPESTDGLPRSVEQLTELVGRMPLREIVRESTDLIERLCIEAALEHTSYTRASAAELLGLSRQSLYLKLNRLGLANGASGDGED